MDAEARQLSPQEANELLASGRAQALDVREAEEWEAGRLAGSRWIPLSELPARLPELESTGPLLVVCRTGSRSSYVADALASQGWEASNLAGGLFAWTAAGLPLEPDDGYVL
jgi:rhodanese-related sulfurtransferase